MAKAIVSVEVEYEIKKGEPVFVSLKVGTQPSIPLPTDVPTPRRLARDLAAAAFATTKPAAPEPEQPAGG